MINTAILMLLAALATAAYLIFSRRRHIPKLNFDFDRLPPVEESIAQIAGLTGGKLHYNVEANVFQNGELLEQLLEAIENAEYTLHFETFVWNPGEFEAKLVARLCQRAHAGVIVRVLIDGVGGRKASPDKLQALRDSGAKVGFFHPVHPAKLRRFNNRNHRKLMVIDGSQAYVFGHGVQDTWCGEARNKNEWRDTGVCLKGPLVNSLQSVFTQDWIEARQDPPFGEGCFPALPEAEGSSFSHVVSSSTRGGYSAVALLYKLALAAARREVIIQNPYFAPEPQLIKLLERIIARGVQVHLMVPGPCSDSALLRRASQRLYARLLRIGVKLYEFQPTLLHQKIVIVDGCWSHLGSTNFDARSLMLNNELGVGILDKEVARKLRAAFQDDLKRSYELRLEQWQARPWYQRCLDWCAYQVHGQI